MFDSVPSYVHSNLPLFAVIFCGIIAAIVSYFFYRRTTPPLPLAWQLMLAILRGLAVAIILILLFAPELTFIWQRQLPVQVALAVDRSGSMNIDNRIDRVNDVVGQIKSELDPKANLRIFLFDTDTMSASAPPIVATDRGTDINDALMKIRNSSFLPQMIVLISDGNFTGGTNPVYSPATKKIKTYTIGIGDTSISSDLNIINVRTNTLVYQNKPTTVQAEIQLQGDQSVRTYVYLKKKGKIVATRQVNLEQSDVIYPVQFEISPNQIGRISYQLEVEPFLDEKILENNIYPFTINVLKGRLHIGLLANEPGFDVKFLAHMLNDREEFSARIFVTNDRIRRPGLDPDSLDVLAVFNTPANNDRDRWRSFIGQNNIPLMLFIDKQPDADAIDFLRSISTIERIRSGSEQYEYGVIRTVEGRIWPALNIYPDVTQNEYFWTKCPPLLYPFEEIIFGEQTEVLLQSNSNPSQPVLMKFIKNNRRGLIFAGRGFWRWHFLLVEDRQFSGGWSEILENSVRWLTSVNTSNNVIVTTHKKEYRVGDAIDFDVQVYDGALNPVRDADVRIIIRGEEQSFEVEADYVSDANYRKVIPSPPRGAYTIEVQAWRNDVRIGTSAMTLDVLPVNSEYISMRQDYRFLQDLARVSGGKYFSADSVKNLLAHIDLTPRINRAEKSIELLQLGLFLVLLISLFLLEWFIRKRKGLA